MFGDILQPTSLTGQPLQPNMSNNGPFAPQMNVPENKSNSSPGLGKDLDSALANLATSLSTK